MINGSFSRCYSQFEEQFARRKVNELYTVYELSNFPSMRIFPKRIHSNELAWHEKQIKWWEFCPQSEYYLLNFNSIILPPEKKVEFRRSTWFNSEHILPRDGWSVRTFRRRDDETHDFVLCLISLPDDEVGFTKHFLVSQRDFSNELNW